MECGEALGKPLETVIPTEPPAVRQQILAGVPQGGVWEGELTTWTAPATRIPVRLLVTPHRNPDGAIVGSVAVIRDLRASRRAEELALRSSRLESTATLASGIAHDFNNLMTVVMGHAELLRARLPNGPEAASLAATVQAAREGARLAEQLLAFARGGKYVVAAVDLNEAVRDVRREALRPGVEIVVRLEDRLWRVEADPNQMRQMVANLLSNAAEAITGRGVVTITTRNVEQGDAILGRMPELKPVRHVRLAVEDTGCGMEPGVLARAFEPFLSTKGQGRGLGLAAAYGISRNQGGAIRGWSEPGKGSGFEVLLPAMDPGTPAVAPRDAPMVLVVEPEESLARLAEAVLTEAGYRVTLMENAAEAAAFAGRPDSAVRLVLLALSTPRPAVVRAFHSLRTARPDLRILICGGGGVDDTVQELLLAGAAAFLAKPYRVEEISRAVRKALAS